MCVALCGLLILLGIQREGGSIPLLGHALAAPSDNTLGPAVPTLLAVCLLSTWAVSTYAFVIALTAEHVRFARVGIGIVAFGIATLGGYLREAGNGLQEIGLAHSAAISMLAVGWMCLGVALGALAIPIHSLGRWRGAAASY